MPERAEQVKVILTNSGSCSLSAKVAETMPEHAEHVKVILTKPVGVH